MLLSPPELHTWVCTWCDTKNITQQTTQHTTHLTPTPTTHTIGIIRKPSWSARVPPPFPCSLKSSPTTPGASTRMLLPRWTPCLLDAPPPPRFAGGSTASEWCALLGEIMNRRGVWLVLHSPSSAVLWTTCSRCAVGMRVHVVHEAV